MGLTERPDSENGDCLACRLVGTGGLLGASAYVWYHGRHLKGFGKFAAYTLCGDDMSCELCMATVTLKRAPICILLRLWRFLA
ncbi:hypothetical protein HPB51_014938 [Rhipicephalus microplus]|uniref:Distal membrane-arm assembly complex protein 1-like domain-containing protein n=1 Tax=Rhipicephalus microplus TaxID=6941 RepID=A0A9J6E1Z9_RHIMP|nr:hypothetical protein HPB51_014938 [Rhipicephalus microplus]